VHELAIAQDILAVVLEQARGERVHTVHVRVGALQRVVPDSLRFSFELVAQDTPAAGADLLIEDVPLRICCLNCQVESEAESVHCQACGSVNVHVLGGDEIGVASIAPGAASSTP
jgi:hydrogenase nickel incorporation protein HypA/HybF